jgi:serine protease Do
LRADDGEDSIVTPSRITSGVMSEWKLSLTMGSCTRVRTGPGVGYCLGTAGGLVLGLFWWLLLVSVSPASGEASKDSVPRSPFVELSRVVSPSVVNIRIVRSITEGGIGLNPLQEMFRQFFPGGESGEREKFDLPGTGSGFLVSEEGHILTNNHVIAQADAIFIRFTGQQREYRAQTVGADPSTDLAVLRIEADHAPAPLVFGNSDAIAVGDWAIAIGNPFGNLEGSLTVGVVSAKGRSDLIIAGGAPRYQDFIQTDASINFGNSGGPLVDLTGEVIGVNTAVNTGGQGIGFAIPSNLARRVYEQITAHGRVIRGYLGVRTEAVEDPGASLDSRAGAVRVVAVLEGTPAERGDLRVGDVILEFAGEPVATPQQLMFLIAETPVQQPVACIVRRAEERRELSLTLEEMPNDGSGQLATEHRRWLGMEVSALTDSSPRVQQLREALGIETGSGVLVVAVDSFGPAGAAGIRPGDVLVTVNGREVLDMADYRAIRNRLMDRLEPVRILVRTAGMENYVLVQPQGRTLEQ